MKRRFFAAMVVCMTMMMSWTMALDYPTQPITIICPWAAGGSSDLTCRMVANLAKKHLGVAANVVNRPGGNGAVAYAELAKTIKPDGYTFSLFASGGFVVMPFVQDVGYNIDDFTFVIGTTSEPLAVVVRDDSDLKSLKDVVERFKKTGEPVVNGQSGINGAPYLFSVQMFNNMGVKSRVVPYPGASEAITALLGGELEMALVHPGQVLGNIQSGDVRLIAMVYGERVPSFKDVPTVEEQGFGRIHAETYKGFIIPAKTDPAIVAWLNERLAKLMDDPEYVKFLKNNGLEKSLYIKGDDVKAALRNDALKLWPSMEELKLLKPGVVKPAS